MFLSRRLSLLFGALIVFLFFVDYQFALFRSKYYNYYKRTITRPISIRREKNEKTLNVGIFVVLDRKERGDEYQLALNSLRCYCTFHAYTFEVVYSEENETLSKLCPHKDVSFISLYFNNNV